MANVVIVDDEAAHPDILGYLLPRYDIAIAAVASDGIKGLEAIRKHMPNLVILDMEMPRMDGLEMLTALRADPAIAKIPVIVLSANVLRRDAALGAGANAFVTKPYDLAGIVRLIQKELAVTTDA